MKHIHISIEEFTQKFNKEYDFLYRNRDNVAGYRDAVNEFDFRMNSDPQFNRLVCGFAEYRKDYLSSDRECAAFMFTFADYEAQAIA